MLITRECDYAVRAVRALSDYQRKTVNEICVKEHIPFQYAYKILKKLEKSNIVRGIRGANGGYELSADLKVITLMDVIEAIDRNLLLNECLGCEYNCPNNACSECMAHSEFQRIQDVLVKELSSKTISEIFAE